MKLSTRLGFLAGSVFLSQILGSASALAVPSDVLAWSSLEHGITVYKDAVDKELYWFTPLIRFEANREGKTVLRPSTLANGKTQYLTRIIPYFPRDYREMVASNLINVRQDSQLRPVVVKEFGVALPDFGYSFKTASVTNYQYLDVPRLVRFSLDAEEAKVFDELYQDDFGVTVEFSMSYEGMVTDRFYNIEVSCKQMKREVESGLDKGSTVGGTVGNGIVLGADLEIAFKNTIASGVNGVNIVSKGDLPGLQEMLRKVMNTCFQQVDDLGNVIDPDVCRGARCRDDIDPIEPRPRTSPFPSRGSDFTAAAGNLADELLAEPTADEEGILPKADLKLKFKYKSTSSQVDNETVVKHVSMKDATNTTVLPGILKASAGTSGTVVVTPVVERKMIVGSKSAAPAPFASGIRVSNGEQYTINAELIFKAALSSSFGKVRTYTWNSAWPSADGDLYYRIGSGKWTPVNRRAIITSDVAGGGGELQFYIDRSSLFNRIPEKYRKGNILAPAPLYLDGFLPEFTVEVTGRKIGVK